MKAQQKGVALLIVLLILALMVTIAATIAERNGRTYLRTAAQLDRQQAKWYGLAAETLAGRILQTEIAAAPNQTSLMRNGFKFPIEGGELLGEVVDGQACFNLNAINQGGKQNDPTVMPYPAQVFLQLLKNVGVAALQAEQVTGALRDWIDNDNEPGINGAEDDSYMALDVPYLPANQSMQDVSELRTVLGIDATLYRQLLPYVCALPMQKLQVNVNTLRVSQSALLAALFLTEISPMEASQLLQQRPLDGWDSVMTFLAQPALKDIDSAAAKPVLAVKSVFFLADFSVLMGNSDFSQHSLLQMTGNNLQVVQRRYGLGMMVIP